MKKRLAGLFMAAAMCAGLLGGCGTQNDGNQDASQNTATDGANSEGADSGQTGSDEVASITFFGTDRKSVV